MQKAARLSAAIEILADIETRRRPAADALKDWGLSHRFAGSGDRAAIASLVYDSLRRKASASWLMGEATPRAVLLGSLRLARGFDIEAIAALCNGERFAPEPLGDAERKALTGNSLADAPAHVAGDFPDWIEGSLGNLFGESLVAEMVALSARAPVDLRVNTLKVERDAVLAELGHWSPAPTPHSSIGLRIALGEDGRGPSVQSDPAFLEGRVEIQDEGSQLAALLAHSAPGETVVDLCAGGGGKTLALAAAMENKGRLLATDADPRRLAPIHERLRRAGAEAEVRTPRGKADPLEGLDAAADLVVVDAPCTGTGTWRRNPDAKWRLRPGSLSLRVSEQAKVLDRAAWLAKPGGRIAYITCSVLPEENDDAIGAFLHRHRGWTVEPPETAADAAPMRATRYGVQMTPLRTGTDGFYVARLRN